MTMVRAIDRPDFSYSEGCARLPRKSEQDVKSGFPLFFVKTYSMREDEGVAICVFMVWEPISPRCCEKWVIRIPIEGMIFYGKCHPFAERESGTQRAEVLFVVAGRTLQC